MSELKETGESRDVKPSEAQLDMGKIQASMQGIREQQENDLKDDLEKFKNRPKPPWYGSDQSNDSGSLIPPLSNDVKSEIARIQSLPLEDRRQAVADFHKTKAGREAGELNGGVMDGGKGVYFRDVNGNQYEIFYQEDE